MTNEIIKRPRLSKNKKRSWRKTDIRDVEDFLEDQRLEERLGGSATSKKDEELFSIHKAKDDVSKLLSGVSRRRHYREKPVKGFSALENNSMVKPLTVSFIKKPQSVTDTAETLEKKPTASRAHSKQHTSGLYDIWNGQNADQRDEHYLRITRKKPVKRRKKLLEKPSGVPAVEIAHPGQSYNPSYEDHQALLQEALDIEKRKIHSTNKLQRFAKSIKKVPAQVQENIWLEEMSAGLKPEPEMTEGEPDPNLPIVVKKIIGERKTLKIRKREALQHSQISKARAKRQENRRINEIYRLASIKKELEVAEKAQFRKLLKKAARKQIFKDKPKRIGTQKYQEPSLPLALTAELNSSLRKLKPSVNMLVERFHSLHKRNMLVPARVEKRKQRKYPMKKYVKKDHREFMEEEEKMQS